ncbi:MAG: hypothetical protein CL902_01070 [Dehalococcoidia bacterium]|nr:hypothetical protein [Dehalococcoidia bacterium]
MDDREDAIRKLEQDLGIVTDPSESPREEQNLTSPPSQSDPAALARAFLVAFVKNDEAGMAHALSASGGDSVAPGPADKHVLHSFSVATRHWREKYDALNAASDAERNAIRRAPGPHVEEFNRRAADRSSATGIVLDSLEKEWKRTIETLSSSQPSFLVDDRTALSTRIMRFLSATSNAPETSGSSPMDTVDVGQQVDMEDIRRIDQRLAEAKTGTQRYTDLVRDRTTTVRRILERLDAPSSSYKTLSATDATRNIATTMLKRALGLESELVGIGAVRHRVFTTIEKTVRDAERALDVAHKRGIEQAQKEVLEMYDRDVGDALHRDRSRDSIIATHEALAPDTTYPEKVVMPMTVRNTLQQIFGSDIQNEAAVVRE